MRKTEVGRMSNKSVGTALERKFAKILADYGFWAHCMKDNQNGQPFDIIAARNGTTYVFDCKDCQGNIFQLSRIEENQYNAMTLWSDTGNGQGLFAIRMPVGIYVVPFRVLAIMKDRGESSVHQKDIAKMGQRFDYWIACRSRCDKQVK